MKSLPILFNGPMVRAILDGTKTQTRRMVKPQPIKKELSIQERSVMGTFNSEGFAWEYAPHVKTITSGSKIPSDWVREKSPYGHPGDRLWVRETWGLCAPYDFTDWERGYVAGINACPETRIVEYRADWKNYHDPNFWRPSIHMPRWASRITLEITAVRVERLNEISEADAIAEGCKEYGFVSARDDYRTLWESINGPGSWAANPWVWVVEFRRVEE